MKKIHVLTGFKLNLGPGRLITIAAGLQSVSDEVADHWFTRQHLAHGGVGTPEYAKAAREQADNAFVKARDAVRDYEELEKAVAEAEEAAGLALTDPSWRRLGHGSQLGDMDTSEPAGADPDDQETKDVEMMLYGSSILPALIDVGAAEPVQLGVVVAAAHARSGLSVDAWNDMPEADREALLDQEVEAMRAANAPPPPPGDQSPPAKPFDEMTDDELRAFLKDRDGRQPRSDATREKLLAKANKEVGSDDSDAEDGEQA